MWIGGLYCPPQIPTGFLRIPAQSQDWVLADVAANYFSPEDFWDRTVLGLKQVWWVTWHIKNTSCDIIHTLFVHTWHMTLLFQPSPPPSSLTTTTTHQLTSHQLTTTPTTTTMPKMMTAMMDTNDGDGNGKGTQQMVRPPNSWHGTPHLSVPCWQWLSGQWTPRTAGPHNNTTTAHHNQQWPSPTHEWWLPTDGQQPPTEDDCPWTTKTPHDNENPSPWQKTPQN